MIVFDTDILSMFAKIDAIDLLKRLFGKRAVMTPKIFATNDIKAREFAKREGVAVISLQAILKALWKKKIKSKAEIKQILEGIKDVDNLAVSRKVEREIFEG